MYQVKEKHRSLKDTPTEALKPNSLISRKDAMYLLYRALLAWQDELPIETEGLSF